MYNDPVTNFIYHHTTTMQLQNKIQDVCKSRDWRGHCSEEFEAQPNSKLVNLRRQL